MTIDITSASTQLPSKLFVEASAGTGKTFLIEHYVVRSLLDQTPLHPSNASPAQLAVITFTKAASKELKARIRKALEETRLVLLGHKHPQYEYLHHFLQSSNRSHLIDTISQTLDHLHEATISTIHGFCDHLLTLWHEKRGEPPSTFLSDREKKEWLVEYLLHLPPSISPEEWKLISHAFLSDQDRLFSFLFDTIDDPPLYTPPDTLTLQKSFTAFSQLFPEKIHHLADALATTASCFRGNARRDGSLPRKLRSFFSALQKLTLSYSQENLHSLIATSLDLPKIFATPSSKKRSPDEDIVFAFLKTVWPHLHPFLDPEVAKNKLAHECSHAFSTFLTLSRKKTFQSMIFQVAALSDNAQFCALCTSQFRYLIVDEFQDTDATQWKIFQLFLKNPNGNTLFVGDPKQAIYAFRKADIYTYLDAKETFTEVRSLTCNFRSLPELVTAQNRLFAPSMFFLPKTQKFLHPLPSSASQHLPENPCASIRFFLAESTFDKRRRWPNDDLEHTFFAWIANDSLQNGISLSHQAVLVKDRYQAQRLQTFLSSRSIPSLAWKVDTLLDTPIYQWLQRALLLIARPNDKKRLLSLLLSFQPDKNLSLCSSLTTDNRLDLWARCALEWTAVSTAFSQNGIAGLAHSLFSCRWDGTRTVEESLSQEQLIDLEHLLELLSSLFLHSLDAYALALSRLGELIEPEKLSRRIDPSHIGIRILTMHASKGLEFDIVYALGCASRTPFQNPPAEADAEKLRQLYVSITRAKKCCHIPLALDTTNTPPPIGQASPVELLLASHSSSWHEPLYQHMTSSDFRAVLSSLSPHILCSDTLPPPLPPPCPNIIAPPAVQSLSGIPRIYRSYSSLRPKISGSSPVFGIRFHKAISHLLRSDTTDIAAFLHNHFGWDDPELTSLLTQALCVQLLPSLCLKDIPKTQLRSECSFLDKHAPNVYERGSIDLLFFHQDRLYLLDWKTVPLPDYSPSSLKQHTLAHGYDLQHQMYKSAALKSFSVPWGGFFFVYVRGLPSGVLPLD